MIEYELMSAMNPPYYVLLDAYTKLKEMEKMEKQEKIIVNEQEFRTLSNIGLVFCPVVPQYDITHGFQSNDDEDLARKILRKMRGKSKCCCTPNTEK